MTKFLTKLILGTPIKGEKIDLTLLNKPKVVSTTNVNFKLTINSWFKYINNQTYLNFKFPHN